jgi:hypothetical protein
LERVILRRSNDSTPDDFNLSPDRGVDQFLSDGQYFREFIGVEGKADGEEGNQ